MCLCTDRLIWRCECCGLLRWMKSFWSVDKSKRCEMFIIYAISNTRQTIKYHMCYMALEMSNQIKALWLKINWQMDKWKTTKNAYQMKIPSLTSDYHHWMHFLLPTLSGNDRTLWNGEMFTATNLIVCVCACVCFVQCK